MQQRLHDVETERLALQAALDGQKSQEERNRLGQFATPTALARDILSYSLSLLPEGAPLRFLDPAFGTGSFYAALLATTPASRIESAQGFEIDSHYEAPARELWRPTPLCLTRADFTTVSPPQSEGERVNLLICNPPYVRHHHLVNGEKVRLQEMTKAAFGMRIDGLAGLYCYFLALAQGWLRAGAVAGWLIPSEFMTVNYGRAVKHYLLHKVTLLRIHRFDPNEVQFDDALVSSAVVFLRNAPPPVDHCVAFTYGGRLNAPALAKQIPADDLRREAKWTRFPVAAMREKSTGPTLKDFFQIKRGLATGDNGFFILTPEEIAARGLPWACFRPILPSPRYLDVAEIKADETGNPLLAKPLFLLDCRLPEEEIKIRYPALWTYLQTGKPAVASRYLCSKRTPWYSQEDRPPAPFICTYIGRSDSKRGKPFRFLLNHSQATAANVYLMLYPKPMLARALAADPTLARSIWQLLDAIQMEALLDEGRVYGGGLHKLEPNELANVKAEGIQALLCEDAPEPLVQDTLFEIIA